jgi:hypothetical protein
MLFEHALKALREGNKVRRICWEQESYLELRSIPQLPKKAIMFVQKRGITQPDDEQWFRPTAADLFAEDWWIIL